MKKIIFLLALVIASAGSQAQNVTVDASGNFKAFSTKGAVKEKGKPAATGKTYTDKEGNVYPVYQSSGGKYYILRISKKTGNEYRFYLKTEA
jgi:acyl-coenzyme A thioesterase PaaI-like protein